MAFDRNDVESWLSLPADSLDVTKLDRLIAAVNAHAADHYDLTDPDERVDQALIMQTARLWQRQYTADGIAFAGSDEQAPVRVLVFDQDVARLLGGRLKVTGLFGPTAPTG